MPTLKLHQIAGSAYPRRVEIYLKEKNIQLEVVNLDRHKLEHKSAGFLALNPAGKVPVLQMLDGRTLPESAAIIEYLEELYPDPPMLGTKPEDRAMVRALERMGSEVAIHLQIYVQHTQPGFAARVKQEPQTAAFVLGAAREGLAVIDKHLAGKPFLAGQGPSIADCTLFSLLQIFQNTFNLRLYADWPGLSAWYQRFSLRESAR
jgi:glutathione S-transferase